MSSAAAGLMDCRNTKGIYILHLAQPACLTAIFSKSIDSLLMVVCRNCKLFCLIAMVICVYTQANLHSRY